MNYIYGLFFNDPEPKCIYIGVTSRTIEERFKEHSRDMRDASTTKDLYFYIRQKGIADRVYVEEVSAMEEGLDTDVWEDFWIAELIRAGHPLQNSIRGNKKIAKKRSDSPDLLKQAETCHKRQEIIEEWYERRNGQMVEISEPKGPRKTQKLTESLRPPSIDELLEMNWKKFDKSWEYIKWCGLMIKRRQHTKKRRELCAQNNKTSRQLQLLDHDCMDYTGLYTRMLDYWIDEGWGKGAWIPLK